MEWGVERTGTWSYKVLLKVIPSSEGSYLDPSEVQLLSYIPTSFMIMQHSTRKRTPLNILKLFLSAERSWSSPWDYSRCLSRTSSIISFLSLRGFSKTGAARELSKILFTPIKPLNGICPLWDCHQVVEYLKWEA